jgi:hypothetical protein
MKNIILEFKEYCKTRNWLFDDYTSEFTFQFRLCRFLEENNKFNIIELESSIERYNHYNLIKKEIDIDIYNSANNKKIAIELKFVRDKGSYNIGMYKFCEDIKFLEELTERVFDKGYAIIFTTIQELFTQPKKQLKPKNIENLKLYNSFRVDKKLSGNLNIKTGTMKESLILLGEYDLIWEDFSDNIKACIVRIEKF